jgi:acetyl esterase/lipase
VTRGVALSVVLVWSVLLAGCGGSSESGSECRATGPFGSGRGEVWLLEPDGQPESVVLFAHGWTAVDPNDWHRPRLDHLCANGSLVVFPRYQVDGDDTFADGADGFRSGVRAAFAELEGNELPVVAAGYSFGGALVSYYAGHAEDWEVPAPSSVLAIFPTTRVAGRPTGTPPAATDFVLLAGDQDEVVGTAGAEDLRAWLVENGHAVDYRLVRSSDELVATHEALKKATSASTETFWDPIDELVEAARESQ